MDISALAMMKNTVKCNMQCELQNSANYGVFEHHLCPGLVQGYICLSILMTPPASPHHLLGWSRGDDDVLHYIDRFGGSWACVVGIAIQILLYADDIVPISFCMDEGLLVKLDKSKFMVFNITQSWVSRSNQKSSWESKRWHRHDTSHTFLGPRFPLYEVACAQFSRALEALSAL